jgi:hypothetical protein
MRPWRVTARNAAPSVMPDASSQARHARTRAHRGAAAVGQASDVTVGLIFIAWWQSTPYQKIMITQSVPHSAELAMPSR